jgi:hypothetical protein
MHGLLLKRVKIDVLEVLLYHRSACESADDSLVELVDYSYRKFCKMIETCERLPIGESPRPDIRFDAKKEMAKSSLESMEEQQKDIDFYCTMSCLSLVRFISDHCETLPLPIIH